MSWGKLYPRLSAHYQFINYNHLFAEVAHLAKFSINIFGSTGEADFVHMYRLKIKSSLISELPKASRKETSPSDTDEIGCASKMAWAICWKKDSKVSGLP